MIPEVVHDHYLKVPVVQRDSYVIRLEEHASQGTFIHCDVFRWTPEVARDLGDSFASLCCLHGGPIHALHDCRDRKHRKFLELYGFQFLEPIEDELELWIWRNNGKPLPKQS